MRLNLLMGNPGDARSGYLNVEDPKGLDLLVDNNEASEIVAHDVLDHYVGTEVDAVLNHWVSKLAHGGTLTVSVVDLREVARSFLAGSINLDDVNILLHGEQDNEFHHRRCCLTLSQLVDVLESMGLKVLQRRVANYRAVVTCQRP